MAIIFELFSGQPRSIAQAVSNANVNEWVIDLAVRHQVIDNFGANDAWSFQKIGAWSETNKAKIADLLFSTNNGIGLSCWRFYLGAGFNHKTIRDDWRTAESFETSPGKYDWTRQANERWFLRAARSRGVRQFAATVYSPPLRLTRNGLSNLGADTNSTTNLKPGEEDAFARYMADTLKHFRDNPDEDERIEFNYIFPVNEPQWDWQRSQEGNRASNLDIEKIYVALKRQLDQDGLRTRILGPESGCIPDMYGYDAKARQKWKADYGNYLQMFCSDPLMASCSGGIITYHSYWSDAIPEELVPHREQLGRAFEKYPGWKIWQSEYCIMEKGRDLGMDSALRVARVIHCDLTMANASAWQWWNAVANGDFKSGLIYTDYKTEGDAETIFVSKIFWVLGNYSRFIRPGMERVEVRGRQDIRGLMASAYRDAANGRLVVVFVNMANEPQRTHLTVANGPGKETALKTFTPYTTSERESLSQGKPVDVSGEMTIPSRSVVTMVSISDNGALP